MDPIQEEKLLLTRRHFFGRMATGVGAAALGSLLNPGLFAALADDAEKPKGPLGAPHFAPKARRVVYLFMKVRPPERGKSPAWPSARSAAHRAALWASQHRRPMQRTDPGSTANPGRQRRRPWPSGQKSAAV